MLFYILIIVSKSIKKHLELKINFLIGSIENIVFILYIKMLLLLEQNCWVNFYFLNSFFFYVHELVKRNYRGFFVYGGMCRFVNDKANTNSTVYWVELQK